MHLCYSPPKSKKKMQLLDHIISTCHMLLTRYPKAVVVIGGDRNEMSITPLLDSIPKLRQIVTKNTCNGNVLDVLLINVPEHYPPPDVVPPVPADNPCLNLGWSNISMSILLKLVVHCQSLAEESLESGLCNKTGSVSRLRTLLTIKWKP